MQVHFFVRWADYTTPSQTKPSQRKWRSKLSTRYSIFTLTWQNRKEETHKPLLVKEILTYVCTLTHLYRRLDYSHVNCSWKWIVRNKSSLVSWKLAAIHFVHDPAPCLRQHLVKSSIFSFLLQEQVSLSLSPWLSSIDFNPFGCTICRRKGIVARQMKRLFDQSIHTKPESQLL